MLRINQLTLTLANGRKITDSLDFTLGRGDKIAVIGEEGDGKSTLLKHIVDPQLTREYCSASGNVIKHGTIGYLAQFASDADMRKSVFEFLGDDFYDAVDYAELLKLPTELLYSERRLASLSGGERVKLRLFGLIAQNPDMLILDEPTNDLDADALDAIERLIAETDKPVLFVSHDVALLERAANGIIHLEQIKRKTECRTTVARMSYAEYVEARKDSLDKQTRIALKQRADYDARLKRWQRVYDRVDHEQRTISRADPAGGRLLKKKMKSVISQRKRFERERDDFEEIPDSEDAMITRFSADAALPRGKLVLDLDLDELRAGEKLLARNVKLTVCGSDKIAITGANGAGKSTLLKEIVRALDGKSGINAAYMPQDYSEALAFDTPLDYLGAGGNVDMTYARRLLGNMRFTQEEMSGKLSALSGGQRAKLIFLRAVLDKSNVLVLDEPTRNFSPLSVPAVSAALRDFNGCIVCVSHDRKFIADVCDKVYVLTENGLLLK